MFNITSDTVLYGILGFHWAGYLWETYLSYRQYKFVTKTKELPDELKSVMTKETFIKARDYSLAKMQFGFIKDAISIVFSSVIIAGGVYAKLWVFAESLKHFEGEVYVSCVWMFILTTIQTIVDLPLSVYYNFVLEEKFGFNKQTAGFYIWDKIKGFILMQALTLPISSVAIMIVKYGGEYFFVWLWMAIGLIILLLLTIYPSYIAPRFDKFTPLPEGELRTQIEALASQLKFPLAQLYVVEGSKRSAHSNAYFYGLFKTKRIVLFDTLLGSEKGSINNDEILAVLTHELGHWQHSHMIKNVAIMQVNLFFTFLVFSKTFKFPLIYQAFGFHDSQPVLVGLLLVMQFVMMPYDAWVSFLMTCLSRRFEFQADQFAVKLGKAEPLQRALIKLTKDNLEISMYDRWYSAWHHSHPPLLERLAALKEKSD